MSAAWAITLARIEWDVFGTLSFRGAHVPPSSIRYRAAWGHLHHAAQVAAVPYGKLLIVLRQECGELGGRFHFHYLLGGTGCANMITLAGRLESSWVQETGAFADVRAYDRSQGGALYVCKCLSGANEYELGKFDYADSLSVSKSVFRVIRKNDLMGTQRALRGSKDTRSLKYGQRLNEQNPGGGLEDGRALGAFPSCVHVVRIAVAGSLAGGIGNIKPPTLTETGINSRVPLNKYDERIDCACPEISPASETLTRANERGTPTGLTGAGA